ncbi:hypothetical protein O181_055852 [Austropuccinia psidii MF-1]|uniref:Tf2-1-like SH3-like domain-containing protein n=1 Tax=Austropuccinia psidii MF-1 TaxID=1389203 RepID=A0A9Q3EEK4_9BASI|nr:hypothetical protein [Austropuccinia psidii MF-1]
MTIVQKDGNIHKNADGMSRWQLPNNIDNPAYVPEEASLQIPIEGISVTDMNTTFFVEVRSSYTQDKNCSILCQLLTTDCKENFLIHALDEIWKQSYDEGRFHLLDGILERARKHARSCIEDSFAYAKDKWHKSQATPDFKVGDLVLLSTTNFNNIKGCKNLKDPFEGPFLIKSLHGENAIEVQLSEELSNKYPTFPVSLVKPYKSSDAEKFPLKNKVPQHIPPIEFSGTKKITTVLKEIKLSTKKVREYLVRYSEPTYEDEWLAEKDIPEPTKLLRRFR